MYFNYYVSCWFRYSILLPNLNVNVGKREMVWSLWIDATQVLEFVHVLLVTDIV